MPVRPVNVSFVVVDSKEAEVLKKKLVEQTYTPAIASHISGILHQLSTTNTLVLGGMSLVAFNAALYDIVTNSSTSGDDVMRLQPLLRKVQTEVTNRYNEITQQR